MTLDLSLGEFSALTTKALRGAGYSWGVSADGAYAARILAQAGLPAANVVVRLLAHIENRSATGFMSTPEWHLSPRVLCPLFLGAALSDLGDEIHDQAPQILASQSVLEPLLVMPALARSTMFWHDGQADINNGQVRLIGNLPNGPTVIKIKRLRDEVELFPDRQTRAAVEAAAYDTLLRWAARTYAPATDASRDAGAGGGATDND